jgi:hypothetical protein
MVRILRGARSLDRRLRQQGTQAGESSSAKEPASQVATNSYSGKIVAFSVRAKTLFLTVGSGANAQTMVAKFDDATKGIDDIAEGHFATIHYELFGGETCAISVQPNKAILPEGITDIGTDEVRTTGKAGGLKDCEPLKAVS